MLFFFVIVIIYAGIGIQFMSDEYIEDQWKPFKDYSSFWPLVLNLYIMITFDNWPAFTKPLLRRRV